MIITAKILLGLALKIVAIHGSDMNVKKLVVVAERKNTVKTQNNIGKRIS